MSVLQIRKKQKKNRRDQKAPAHTQVKLHCQDLPPVSLGYVCFLTLVVLKIGLNLDIIKKEEREKRKA